MRALFVSIVISLTLTGCVEMGFMAANLAAAGAITESAADRRADECYNIETKAEKEKVSRAEIKRRLTKAGCPL